jgi:hypothetical protein
MSEVHRSATSLEGQGIVYPTDFNDLEPPLLTYRAEVLGILAVTNSLRGYVSDENLALLAMKRLFTNEHKERPDTSTLSPSGIEEIIGLADRMGMIAEPNYDPNTKQDTLLVDGATVSATKYRLDYLDAKGLPGKFGEVSISGGQRELTEIESILGYSGSQQKMIEAILELRYGALPLSSTLFPNDYASPYPTPKYMASPRYSIRTMQSKEPNVEWRVYNAPAVSCYGSKPRPHTGSMAHFFASTVPVEDDLVVVAQQPYMLRCGFDIANNLSGLPNKPPNVQMVGPTATEIGHSPGVILKEIGSMGRQALEFIDDRSNR